MQQKVAKIGLALIENTTLIFLNWMKNQRKDGFFKPEKGYLLVRNFWATGLSKGIMFGAIQLGQTLALVEHLQIE